MSYKFIDNRTSVDPKTGERITPEQFLERGYTSSTMLTSVNKEWEARETATPQKGVAVQIIKDLEPYIPAAAEKHNGSKPIIGGRRQHKEFLRRNGYVEVGNSFVKPQREYLSTNDRISDIRQAMKDR